MLKIHQEKGKPIHQQTHFEKKVGFALKKRNPPGSDIDFSVNAKTARQGSLPRVKPRGKHEEDGGQKKPPSSARDNTVKDAVKTEIKNLFHDVMNTFQSGIMIKGKDPEQKALAKGWLSVKKDDLADIRTGKRSNKMLKHIFIAVAGSMDACDKQEVAAWVNKHSAWLWGQISGLQAKVIERMTVKPISMAKGKK